ncbi:MAG: hypothetical protein IJR50_06990 [Treponema sp.]|nr:hypothetical protein [Treponema sp.]
MAATANLSILLRSYANKQGSAFINRRDFCDYMKRYAERHVEENADLVRYLGNPEDMVVAELEKLEKQHLVALLEQSADKHVIVVLSYYAAKFAQRYKEISFNAAVLFPSLTDLPKQLPIDAIEKRTLADLFAKQDLKSLKLLCIQLQNDTPSILFPECVPIHILTDAALAKIRTMLKKEEYHDYFYKKLRNANPGKEITSKTFFEQFITRPETALQAMETSGDSFYFWNQLCHFIRKDFEKIKDSTLEDTNLLQSIAVSEQHLMLVKNKMQQERQKNGALKNLEESLDKPPYFYSMNSILKFTNQKGVQLYGQYSDNDLKNFLEALTTKSEGGQLPRLLVFKVKSGTRYFIYKTKVFPLVVRLCNEAHDTIKNNLTDEWFKVLQAYEKRPEMHDKQKFEEMLKAYVEKISPVLHALLNANFLTLLDIELQSSIEGGDFKLFSNGRLLPYTELLMLDNAAILANAKILLPFWYLIPIVSQIIGFFRRKPKKQQAQEEKTADDMTKKSLRPVTKHDAIVQAAKTLESHYVPENSTIDRELDSYEKQWNKLITKDAHAQLTEDVNALIRDYMRKVIRTISAQTFTVERVESLARSLVKNPNMQKITDQNALYMYVQLYILRLVGNG